MPREGRVAGGIDRRRQDSTKDATEKSSHPFRAVFAPQKNAITLGDAAIFKRSGEAPSQRGKLSIAGAPLTQAAARNDGDVGAVPLETFD